ncbi:MAG: ComF family protein [Candidatus Moraniibacteriota bacterium]|nr:MAG: ComF family protein [Candidatus Moranbacteria bacterium]
MATSLFDKSLQLLWSTFLKSVYPLTCYGCHREGALACPHCLMLVPEPDSQTCPLCRAPFSPNGATCTACRSKTALDGVFVARPYRFRLVTELIHALKYRFLEPAHIPLVDLLETSLAHHSLPLPESIIPVPLHPRRLRFRGFNQAELIARTLAKRLTPGLPLPVDTTSLRRIRFTKPQMKTETREERQSNLTGAFAATATVAGPLVGRYVWLIDDVATTGTTLEACALALKQAGVKKVWGVVVAR